VKIKKNVMPLVVTAKERLVARKYRQLSKG